ncbi:hypothetical protein SCUCBS95973_007515 [Sporothrix curviconia]|uniref:DRBM domain-containing protein n=1 Tax=Sporothrix curviconia TaxID=1260050 RepID=A0ABP0CDY6_9PEZI
MGSQLQSSKYIVSYDSLKAWIYDQEEHERRTGHPAPLTEEQLEAIAILVPPPPPPPSASIFAQGSETDFVSMLMRRWFPDKDEPRPQDSIFQNKKASRRHAARCAVEWLISEGLMSSSGDYIVPTAQNTTTTSIAIPRMAVVNTGTASTVAVARGPPRLLASGINRITAAGTSPVISESSPAPTPTSNSSTNANIPVQSQQENLPASQPSFTTQSMASWEGRSYANTGTWKPVVAGADNGVRAINKVGSSSVRASTASSAHFRDGSDYEGVTKTQLLDSLCRMRKLGSPSYKLTPVGDDAQGVFNGHIVFASLGTKGASIPPVLPEGVGEVREVYTKKAAKEKIAESVLQYMMSSMLGPVEA